MPYATVLRVVALCLGLAILPRAEAKPRSNRDWSKMTEADWAKVEEDWEDPEDKAEREKAQAKMEAKMAKQKSGAPPGFDMEAFQKAQTDEERQKILSKVGKMKAPVQGQGMAMGMAMVKPS